MDRINVHVPGNTSMVSIMCPVGSAYEPKEIKGVSHFVEHMCFKGGKKFPLPKQGSELIERCGGDINAFTDSEWTCYYAHVPNHKLQTALDVVQDMVIYPKFPAKEVDKEREVIMQELKMYEDSPSESVWDFFSQILFKKESGLFDPIVGTRKSLYAIDQKVLREFHQKHYNNLVMLVTGDVKSGVIRGEPNFHCPELTIDDLALSKPLERQRTVTLERGDVSQANSAIGDITRLCGSNRFIYFDLLEALYNDMSGRLFQKVREQHNLVYRVGFHINPMSNGFLLWTVALGLEKSKIKFAREIVQQVLTAKTTKEEREYAVEKAVGTYAMMTDHPVHVARMQTEQIRFDGANIEKRLPTVKEYANLAKAAVKKLDDVITEMQFDYNVQLSVVPARREK
jgi:predicted Zn-dependent peptidase